MIDYQKWFDETFPTLEINRPWSILPDTACFLFDLLQKLRPQNVLELGSGVSTVVMAKAVAEFGGVVYSLEHEMDWLEVTRKMCRKVEITNATVFHAPLIEGQYQGVAPFMTYSMEELPFGPYDFVLIDGPPGFDETCPGRRGTLYSVMPFLGDRAVIVLDDADRVEEREAVVEWMSVFGEVLKVKYMKFERPLFFIEVNRGEDCS